MTPFVYISTNIFLTLGAYPQVQAFIKSDRVKRYPGLTIKYVRGADPIIKLLDDDEFAVEVKHHFISTDISKEL